MKEFSELQQAVTIEYTRCEAKEFFNRSLEVPGDPVNLCVRDRNFLRSLPPKVQSVTDSFFS